VLRRYRFDNLPGGILNIRGRSDSGSARSGFALDLRRQQTTGIRVHLLDGTYELFGTSTPMPRQQIAPAKKSQRASAFWDLVLGMLETPPPTLGVATDM